MTDECFTAVSPCVREVIRWTIIRYIKFVYVMVNCSNAIIRQCISNADYNANSLICYKSSKLTD